MVLTMLDRVRESGQGYPVHQDDDLSSAIETLERRISRLERQIAEEPSAFMSTMMRGVLAEVTAELAALKTEWTTRTNR